MPRRAITLKEAMLPLIWLNCIFCMGIFEIPTNRPRYILSVIYVIISSIAYFTLFVTGLIHLQHNNIENAFLSYVIIFVNVMVATLSMFLYWRNSKYLYVLLKRLSNVDDSLETLGIKKNYKKIFHDVIIVLTMYILCMILLNVAHVVWMGSSAGSIINIHIVAIFGLPVMMNSVVDVSFSSLIRCIQRRFKRMNEMIEDVVMSMNVSNCFKEQNKRKVTPIRTASTSYGNNKDAIKHLMQTMKQLHLELTRIAHDINGSFCWQLLLEIAVHFTIVTSSLYLLYCSFRSYMRYSIRNERIAAMLIWASIYSIKIMLVNNLCTTISHEAYRTGEIIQTFEGSLLDNDNELREEIIQFTQQIVLNSLNFSAARFFTINNAFTGKFFSTVTTYVVILIQMNA